MFRTNFNDPTVLLKFVSDTGLPRFPVIRYLAAQSKQLFFVNWRTSIDSMPSHDLMSDPILSSLYSLLRGFKLTSPFILCRKVVKACPKVILPPETAS